jgi:hypothetical protein
MAEADPADRLSAKREFFLVLRVAFEHDGRVSVELVDPLSEQRERVQLDGLAEAVRVRIADSHAR